MIYFHPQDAHLAHEVDRMLRLEPLAPMPTIEHIRFLVDVVEQFVHERDATTDLAIALHAVLPQQAKAERSAAS